MWGKIVIWKPITFNSYRETFIFMEQQGVDMWGETVIWKPITFNRYRETFIFMGQRGVYMWGETVIWKLVTFGTYLGETYGIGGCQMFVFLTFYPLHQNQKVSPHKLKEFQDKPLLPRHTFCVSFIKILQWEHGEKQLTHTLTNKVTSMGERCHPKTFLTPLNSPAPPNP